MRLGNTLFVCGTNPMPLVTSWSARWLVISSPLSSDGALVDLDQAEQRLEQGRLAGAVGADDADELAGLAVQVGAVEDVDARQVAGDQVVGPQDGTVGAGEVLVALGRRWWGTRSWRRLLGRLGVELGLGLLLELARRRAR